LCLAHAVWECRCVAAIWEREPDPAPVMQPGRFGSGTRAWRVC